MLVEMPVSHFLQGPNSFSSFSSNWHDRLQWLFNKILSFRDEEETVKPEELRREFFEAEIALSQCVCVYE